MITTKEKIHNIIFKHDTKPGKLFDLWLIAFVFLSVITVTLETVNELKINYNNYFHILEWFFTIIFSIELLVRLYCVKGKLKYLFSFYGIVDIVSVLPSYLSFFLPGAQSFLIIRALRMLRIFRILKLNQYTMAGKKLSQALISSRPKIVVFLLFVLTLVMIIGALMYLIESEEAGFTSIPKSVYWAIVTMTTVGYGDITPQTILGQIISSFLMITGYGVIAVPTGLISAEIVLKKKNPKSITCNSCNYILLEDKAHFCSNCGKDLLVKKH